MAKLIQFPAGQFQEDPVLSLPRYVGSSDLLKDGAYRIGATVDVGFDWSRHNVIAGAESFYEAVREFRFEVSGIAEGEDREVLQSLDGSRLVLASFVNDRVTITDAFKVEGGVRLQAAPGDDGYAPIVLTSAALLLRPFRKV